MDKEKQIQAKVKFDNGDLYCKIRVNFSNPPRLVRDTGDYGEQANYFLLVENEGMPALVDGELLYLEAKEVPVIGLMR